MLNNNYIQKFIELEDVIIESIEKEENTTVVSLKMKQCNHNCPSCNKTTSKIHDYRTQLVKDIPFLNKPLFLKVKKRRYVCPNCSKKFYENIPFLPRYQRTTNRLWGYAINLLGDNKSMKQVVKETNLSISTILRITDKLSYTNITLPHVISIDEFKGDTNSQKYQCILTNPKTHKVLDIIESRKADDLYSYFSKYKDRNNVQIVVMDMSNHFRYIMKTLFPNAHIVADKYHVMRQVTWAFENVRKTVQKDFHPSRRKYFKHSRRLLLKQQDKLTKDELAQVSLMLSLSKPLAKAYYLKNEFYKVMNAKDAIQAKHLLGQCGS